MKRPFFGIEFSTEPGRENPIIKTFIRPRPAEKWVKEFKPTKYISLDEANPDTPEKEYWIVRLIAIMPFEWRERKDAIRIYQTGKRDWQTARMYNILAQKLGTFPDTTTKKAPEGQTQVTIQEDTPDSK